MGENGENHSVSQESKNHSGVPKSDLWTDGIICAFEFIRGPKKHVDSKQLYKGYLKQEDGPIRHSFPGHNPFIDSPAVDYLRSRSVSSLDFKEAHVLPSGHVERSEGSHWVPIGWTRITKLVQQVQVNAEWPNLKLIDDEEDVPVTDLAAPYWERPGGPTWWCHLTAGNSFVEGWLRSATWLHPAISLALRDESKLISERMRHLLYEVPVRVDGGLLFELLGQSMGDPVIGEDDVPVVFRSWQAKNFLVSVMHIKGNVSKSNVLGITEVEELLYAGSYNVPRTIHEVIAHLACRLSRWDDRLFRKSIFGAADEIELKFMNRRNHEDLNLFSIILNQEIRKLAKTGHLIFNFALSHTIRVKWSLHAREEIILELLQHLRGNIPRHLLEGLRNNTREMLEEQEAVRGRLFTIQDNIQSNIRSWLQRYLGPKKPITEEHVEARKLELQNVVKIFQHEAETHAQLRRNNLSPTAGDVFDADYFLIQ
ncbi:unnamed protein product [Arabidopsis thaliana]|uniref:Magnesium transporter CorA-like family protein n=1 Tax=Arabidopsis thaliana TaxID=3702 RepID=A0A654EFI8_ARATH|nr:unnamed protein product [Arabidopsis thaliana]